MLKLNPEIVSKLFNQNSQKPYFQEIQRFMCSDVVVGLEIVGENAMAKVKRVVGPENPIFAKSDAP